jgi:hypothetical protein
MARAEFVVCGYKRIVLVSLSRKLSVSWRNELREIDLNITSQTLAGRNARGAPGRSVTDLDEACRIAQNLGRNCGFAVFPCREDKRPACPHGFKDGSTKPAEIAELWRSYRAA